MSKQPTHSSLSVKDSISADPGQTVYLDLCFEPCNEAVVNEKLQVTSPDAGDFIFPIIATGCLPKPSGPYVIKPGGKLELNIKNVSNSVAQYKCFVDSPSFVVKEPSFQAQPGKEATVEVNMLPRKELGDITLPEFPITGKLKVLLIDVGSTKQVPTEFTKPIVWEFYLKGDLSDDTEN